MKMFALSSNNDLIQGMHYALCISCFLYFLINIIQIS